EYPFMLETAILGAGDVHEILADKILLAASAVQGIENVLPVTVLAHDADDGCTVANYYGTELVLPISPHLAKGAAVNIAIRSSDIALSRQHLNGTSIQNQIKGRICAIIRTPEHALVQVDCGSTLLAGISPRALKQMSLHEGESVYCLVKAHAFSYIDPLVPRKQQNGRLY
ncbi:MAG: TOBE domain-containing protein, partial [Hyphomicrobiaceae bacterium]